MGTIDENALQNISLIINLSKEIQVKERDLNPNTDEIPKYFPSFLWVVRDFTLRLVDNFGAEISSVEYLERALELQKGTSDTVENKNKIRRMIKHFFQKRDWVTLVRPVEGERMLQNLNKLPEEELRPAFLKQLKGIQTKIRKKVEPKMLNGKVLNGPMLLELCRSYLNAINKGNVPCIENAWNYVLKFEAEKLITSLVKEYKECIESLLPDDSSESLLGLLSEIHEEITPKILEKFQNNVINESRELELELCQKIDWAYSEFFHMWELKEETKCKIFLNQNIETLEKDLRKGLVTKMDDFNQALTQIKSQYMEKSQNLEKEKNSKIWRTCTERIILKAGEYISRSISQKHKQDYKLLSSKYSALKSQFDVLNQESESLKSVHMKELHDLEKKNLTLKSTIKMMEQKMVLSEKQTSEKLSSTVEQYTEEIVS